MSDKMEVEMVLHHHNENAALTNLTVVFLPDFFFLFLETEFQAGELDS
jgi:hypothetical protein